MSRVYPPRAYAGYWERLKATPMSPKYRAKVLTLSVPESLVKRVKRMISKEKDGDWQFKNDHGLNPWKLTFRITNKVEGKMNGHGTITLMIMLDRRTDL